MDQPRTPGSDAPAHNKKFTEGLLDEGLIISSLGIKPGQTIVDAGCGTGYMARIFARQMAGSGTVYAIDPDKSFIRVLKGELDEANVEAMVGDVTQRTDVPDASADVVYIATVIHIFREPRLMDFLREAMRMLKSGGLLAIVEIEKKPTPFGPALQNRYSPDELKALVPMDPAGTVQVGEHFYMQLFRKP